jgi:hypothetical protein
MGMKQAKLSEANFKKMQEADIMSIHCKQTAIVGGGKTTEVDAYVALMGVREDAELFAVMLTSYAEAEEYAHGILMAAKAVFDDKSRPKLDA